MKLKRFRFNYITASFWVLIILIIISWTDIIMSERGNLFDIFTTRNFEYLSGFINNLLGKNTEYPAFLDTQKWVSAIRLSWDTFVMSILAIGFATLGMVIFVFPTARNVVNGSLTLKTYWYYKPLYYIGRLFFIISRSVPELLWAMILVYIFKPGILPGALALALHNFGILGKLVGEVIEDIDSRPINNLALNGASQGQIVLYSVIPDIMPKVINYILYRFENIIRASLIVGFVGAGGLGQQFRMAMSFFRYTDITLYLICYLILVYIADIISALAKQFIRGK